MTLFKRCLSLTLSFLLVFGSVSQVHAAVVTNQQIINQAQQAYDRESLLQTIRRDDVQQQLLEMGVASQDLEDRVNQMTSEEIAQLNQQMAEMPAGGSVVGIILLIFIIFVITDVIGATDIFPFIHPVK
jgi:Mg2+ and Co2+ transporter CorA